MTALSYLSGGIALTALIVCLQVALRLIRGAPVPIYFGTALAVHLLTVAVATQVWPGLTYWHGAAVYWFGFVAYLFVFGAVYKSVSLSILRELWRAPSHRVKAEAVASDIVLPTFLSRIEILRELGLVEKEADNYRISRKGIILAGRITAVQKFFGIDKSGLYDH